jgi:hypothetical protein
MVAVGGMGTLGGPVLGAVLLSLLPEALRDLAALRMVVFGALLMLIMWLRPQGLLGGVPLLRGLWPSLGSRLFGKEDRSGVRGAAYRSEPQ